MIAPITTGPTGSWNGTVDRFAIILPRSRRVQAQQPDAVITTGPTGSWNGTVDRFAIILPRQMNVYVAYKLSSTDAVSIVTCRPVAKKVPRSTPAQAIRRRRIRGARVGDSRRCRPSASTLLVSRVSAARAERARRGCRATIGPRRDPPPPGGRVPRHLSPRGPRAHPRSLGSSPYKLSSTDAVTPPPPPASQPCATIVPTPPPRASSPPRK